MRVVAKPERPTSWGTATRRGEVRSAKETGQTLTNQPFTRRDSFQPLETLLFTRQLGEAQRPVVS